MGADAGQAQGLNYSFRTVIFGSWARWNGARRQREPIGKGDFHNIAGRAGRLGKIDDDQFGRVIFCAKNRAEQEAALLYLDSEVESIVTGKIDPNRIDQLALQLLSSGLIRSSEGLLLFLQESLTGFIAKNAGVNQDAMWQERLDAALRTLVQWGFIRE
jgi:helicase